MLDAAREQPLAYRMGGTPSVVNDLYRTSGSLSFVAKSASGKLSWLSSRACCFRLKQKKPTLSIRAFFVSQSVRGHVLQRQVNWNPAHRINMASSRIEELPDDFNDEIDLNNAPPAAKNASLEEMIARAGLGLPKKNAPNTDAGSSLPGAAMPPAMEEIKQHSTEEVLDLMNRMPLFMTSLDETDGAGGENIALEALKALAYEGTRAENAQNFREQGNEQAKVKNWTDAREFYNKALGALKLPQKPQDPEEGPADMDVVELDEEEEARKEKEIEEASYTNRALCNLEMKNYGSCNRDCAAALRLNPRNVKAWYRSATACLALDKMPEARDACDRGLKVDEANKPLQLLLTKITKRAEYVAEIERKRREREERVRREAATLKHALKARNIPTRSTTKAPEMEDANITLENPVDAASTLSFPVMLLYPLHHKTDFIKALAEDESVGQHLSYILPLPWDEKHEYMPEKVECYVETTAGGLIKAGKKMALLRILNPGKVEIVDGLLKINVVPKSKAAGWIEDFKKNRALRS